MASPTRLRIHPRRPSNGPHLLLSRYLLLPLSPPHHSPPTTHTESPRWLLKKGRYHEALSSFRRLRNSDLQACRDFYYVHRQLTEEFEVLRGSSYISRFIELFTIPRVRRATLASFVVMIAQQMCGINIIAFYSSTVFVEAGYSQKQALLASWGYGMVNWVFAFPAVWVGFLSLSSLFSFIYLLDGKRRSIRLDDATSCCSLFPTWHGRSSLLGSVFSFPPATRQRFPLSRFLFISLQVRLAPFSFFGMEQQFIEIECPIAFYSPGEGPVPFTYSAEVFPLTHREMGMCVPSLHLTL